MDSEDFFDVDAREEPIFFVQTLKCTPERFEQLYRKVADFLDFECERFPGYVGAQLLTGEDGLHMIVVTEWESREAWRQTQWEATFGELTNAMTVSTPALGYNLYFRECFTADRAVAGGNAS